MKHFNLVKIIPFFLFLLQGIYCFAQFAQNNRSAYIGFDEIVGTMNLRLANGVEYIEEHRTINDNTKFLFSRDFITGSITYDGQTYFNIPMKFNVYDDVVIVKLRENLKMAIFQLLNEKLKGFALNGHNFIRLPNSDGSGSDIQGFYEVLFKRPNFKLLKKYRKNQRQRLEEDFVYYEFFPARSNYIVSAKNDYYSYDSKRDLFDVFPERKAEIRDFYRTYKSILKSNPELFMINLFEELFPSEHKNVLGE